MSVMPPTGAQARRHLDARLRSLRPLLDAPRPHRGWVRAIRDALGMSSSELATRMGVRQSTAADLEQSELRDSIKLDTLRRAADALECDLVYFLVPRAGLDETVKAQAARKAAGHLGGVAHHSRLEDQTVGDDDTAAQLEELAGRFIDRRGLWSDGTSR
jgi:predicted DNA-binding mobile mystery protein A